MKKVLLALLIAFGTISYGQQAVAVYIAVTDSAGFAVPNQVMTAIERPANSSVIVNTVITDANGVYSDSIGVAPLGSMTYIVSSFACTDSVRFAITPNVTWISDTLVICGSGSSSCNYTVSSQVSGAGVTSFSSTYQGSPASSYLWTFGDGTSSTAQNPTHTYSQAGAYYYCLQADACPAVCDSLVVGAPASCNALWTVDSVNSINFAGNIVLWNLSTGGTAINPLNYIWDWGDGTTSSGQYPMHTYSDTGIYNICLTVIDPITNCTDTHCDSLGFDANGNLVYKGTIFTGFTVMVVDPATIGTKEMAVEPQLDAYPNPTSGKLFINSETHVIYDVKVFSINGQMIQQLEFNQGNSEPVEINIDQNGVYLVRISTEAGIVNRKVLVD